MNLELTEEQDLVIATVRRFVREKYCRWNMT